MFFQTSAKVTSSSLISSRDIYKMLAALAPFVAIKSNVNAVFCSLKGIGP